MHDSLPGLSPIMSPNLLRGLGGLENSPFVQDFMVCTLRIWDYKDLRAKGAFSFSELPIGLWTLPMFLRNACTRGKLGIRAGFILEHLWRPRIFCWIWVRFGDFAGLFAA